MAIKQAYICTPPLRVVVQIACKGDPLDPLHHFVMLKETPHNKNKMVKKLNTENRTKQIKVRVNSDEEIELLKRANNIPLSKFMREFCLGNELPSNSISVTADPKLLAQLSSIGNLLNQALRLANSEAKAGYSLNAMRLMLVIESTQRSLEELKNAS
ncbi:hypothetical protein OMA37_004516 [Vibrio fluvialis]|nr:hypothetical protein [Vibrio fluvialis]